MFKRSLGECGLTFEFTGLRGFLRRSGGMIDWAFNFQFRNDRFYKFTHGTDILLCPILHDEVPAILDDDMP